MNARSKLCLGVVFFFLASIANARLEGEPSFGSTSESTDGRDHEWMTIKDGADSVEKSRNRWFSIARFDGSRMVEEQEENCTKRSIEEFPDDLFTLEQRRHGAVVLHALFGFYCFVLTAYVCNDYLLPALDCICTGMNISGDVAGATFLATANCFPELFVNVIGTFLTESDLGVGTVVGGAVFNTFATPACGALSTLHGIQLEWRILSRDCLIYVLSVGTLVMIMWDGLIVWYEAVILMVLFVGYLLLLFCSRSLIRCYRKVTDRWFRGASVTEKKPTAAREDDWMPQGLYRPYFHNELIAEYRQSCTRSSAVLGLEERGEKKSEQDENDRVQPDTPFAWPKSGFAAKLWFLLTWPIKLLLFVTIPDCRYDRCRSWYPLTFVMCVVWIAVSSYLTSWMMTVIGDTLEIADSIMGITFLSAGGNMPELVSIVILSRQGNGDMAMSNTIGANTLDILLCLGLPWTIKTMLTGKNVEIVSGALTYSVLSIILCVIAFYSIIAFCKFRLNKTVGVICLILYGIFLTFAILIELNVFFVVNLPMCEHST